MINFKHDAENLRKAFDITDEEDRIFDEIMQQMKIGEKAPPVSWVVQRLWIDERLSDNARAYAIFTLGRFYEFWHFMRGLPGTEN